MELYSNAFLIYDVKKYVGYGFYQHTNTLEISNMAKQFLIISEHFFTISQSLEVAGEPFIPTAFNSMNRSELYRIFL